jgi:hypothetical protein
MSVKEDDGACAPDGTGRVLLDAVARKFGWSDTALANPENAAAAVIKHIEERIVLHKDGVYPLYLLWAISCLGFRREVIVRAALDIQQQDDFYAGCTETTIAVAANTLHDVAVTQLEREAEAAGVTEKAQALCAKRMANTLRRLNQLEVQHKEVLQQMSALQRELEALVAVVSAAQAPPAQDA